MKKTLSLALAGLSFVAGAAFAGKVRDWRDLHKAHMHLKQVINEMERARAAR